MSDITAPTLDQITGYTVMEKMRSLIKNYVDTTAQIIDRVEDTVTQEEIATYLEQYLADYYTKEQIDEIIANLNISNYYTKSETDTLLSAKANTSNVYNKTETDNLLSAKANSNNVYTKSETDTLLNTKANSNNVYTKSETDTLLSAKANSNNVYTKSETDNLLSAKQDELTAGTGITIQNNVISATGGTGGETWVVVGENDWATYVDDNRYMSAKEDLKVRFQLNNGIKGEYYVYKNYSIFDVNARILANVFYANSALKISYFVNGYDANNNRNSVTSNKFYYDIVTIASDGTTDTVNMQASKVQQGVMSSHYFEILHKL